MQFFSDEVTFYFLTLLLGFTYGFIAQRKQFCFSGSIKDLVLFQHSRRTASLMAAIVTVIIVTQSLSFIYGIDFTTTKYYLNINYLLIIVGGLMFGYGMMISDGCSSRHLIKVAQGEKDSFWILLSLGIFSFITYKFIAANILTIQDMALIKSTMAGQVYSIPLYIVLPILLYVLYKSLLKCMNILQTLDGVAIGFLVGLGWLLTTIVADKFFINVPHQSLSFVYPLGKLIEYVANGFSNVKIIFSVMVVFGVLLGSFVSSKTNKKYAKKQMCDNSQQNPPSLLKKMIGGAFMGVGGIIAVGCTVGQGLSGVSTLSSASFLAIISIYISAYFTAKHLHKNNALVACFVFDFEIKKPKQ